MYFKRDFMTLEAMFNCQIVIIDFNQRNKPSHVGDTVQGKKPLYLLLIEEHFHFINSIVGYLDVEKYCLPCCVGYRSRDGHKCKGSDNQIEKKVKCKICGLKDVDHYTEKMTHDKYQPWLDCNDCNRKFPTIDCFENHLSTGQCGSAYKCLDCERKMFDKTQPRETHQCGDYKCFNCGNIVPKEHKCFMREGKSNFDKNTKYEFFDFESMSDETHIVNYAVLQNQNGEEKVFPDVNKFCQYVIKPENSGKTILAHNMKGYDGVFIYNWLINHNFTPYIIYSGSKIMSMEIKDPFVRIIDSYNFF
eukprot:Lithocolla_globosa_v1_NODE_1230_length_2754_cov_22.616525.p1 type:complete len:304 gc:universal NODE_1230_length_2754_cov_22.616525:1872-961(-)